MRIPRMPLVTGCDVRDGISMRPAQTPSPCFARYKPPLPTRLRIPRRQSSPIWSLTNAENRVSALYSQTHKALPAQNSPQVGKASITHQPVAIRLVELESVEDGTIAFCHLQRLTLGLCIGFVPQDDSQPSARSLQTPTPPLRGNRRCTKPGVSQTTFNHHYDDHSVASVLTFPASAISHNRSGHGSG